MSGLLLDAPKRLHPTLERNLDTPIAHLIWDIESRYVIDLSSVFVLPSNDVLRAFYVRESCTLARADASFDPLYGYSGHVIWTPLCYETLDDFVKEEHPSFSLIEPDRDCIDVEYINLHLTSFLDSTSLIKRNAILGEIVLIAQWWARDFTTPVYLQPPSQRVVELLGKQALLYRAVHMASDWNFAFEQWVSEILPDALSLEEAIEWTERVVPYIEAGMTDTDELNRLFELDIDPDIGWALVGQTAC